MLLSNIRAKLQNDSGSAVAEYSLVSILLAFLALSVLQLALFLYLRNSLTDIAVQAAHYAALENNQISQGQVRAENLIKQRFPHLPDSRVEIADLGNGVIEVEIATNLPMLGFWGPSNSLTVQGHGIDEDSW